MNIGISLREIIAYSEHYSLFYNYMSSLPSPVTASLVNPVRSKFGKLSSRPRRQAFVFLSSENFSFSRGEEMKSTR